jgi:hypothetical protein
MTRRKKRRRRKKRKKKRGGRRRRRRKRRHSMASITRSIYHLTFGLNLGLSRELL